MSDQLLNEIIESLQQIESVQAAWLAGSRGRGTNDEFSDIDIWVALDNAAMPAVVDDPLAFVETIVPTVMHISAPSIAPTGGAFLGCWVPIEGVICQVDWYFTPTSTARLDADTQIVFGDIPAREFTALPPLSDDYIVEKVNDNLVMALQMINNMIKHSRRGHGWLAVDHARHADRCLIRANAFIDQATEPDFLASKRSLLPEPPANDTAGFQSLAVLLLDEVEKSSVRAEMRDGIAGAVSGVREVLLRWQQEVTDDTVIG